MKIVILGAGQVGSTVATSLSSEENDITVVDINATHLKELQDRLDIRGVLGHASHPRVLVRAGIEDADMVIALTSSDEVNMTACQVAYTLYNTPLRIARIRDSQYIENPKLFEREHCPVDVLISPETLVTEYIARLIEYPGALQVLDFADGRAQLVATQAYAGGPLVGHRLQTLREHMPADADARVAAIYRQDKTIIPDGKTVIEENDTVFFLAAQKNISMMMRELRPLDNPIRRVILAGGGHIGANLARYLERDHHVKIIERDADRAEIIAEHLERAIVLVGDCADEELLREEAVDSTDVYCVLTNDDEANILSSMLAKKMGAEKVIAIINRPAYVDLVEAGSIDIAVSPQQITIGALLTHIRRGNMVRIHSLRRGAAEAIEAVALGDKRSSRVVGRAIEDIDLPPGTTIPAIVRGEEVIIAHHDTVIHAGDHVILFVPDKRQIAAVERLFQVGAIFV
ncbi:MAG: Trk system potassium transporter TrkA [Gammaproteobacteria bacterium]|jgi:trk system potassium uptake protein TrkA|nr:Trk system potassium transporter TrkA [Gammaproteobacteria bacterium]MBT8056261.1 Trk system potassium transporter TrkA [Gammaproteobacteria bacterium]NNJ79271.1 Trk system potassium transporter TrkA [Xanthomonadales bacterium]